VAEEKRWPFGKHQGTLVENLPTAYIEWALENMENPPFAEELQNQLDLRAGRGVSRGKRED
jgi:uncharacterized protein (DUF3820 family)